MERWSGGGEWVGGRVSKWERERSGTGLDGEEERESS